MGSEEQKRNRISIINEDILCDKTLSLVEKVVYARICYFEVFFEGAEATAEYLGLRTKAVQNAKRLLEKKGNIICVKNTGRGKMYVADVNYGVWLKRNRTESSRNEEVRPPEMGISDLPNREVRPPKMGSIGKNIEENVGKKENKVDSKRRKIFRKPSVQEVQAYCEERGNSISPEEFVDFYESKGWVVGKSPMKDWKAAVRTWERNGYGSQKKAENTRKELIYQPRDGEDITYQRMFERWKQYLGVNLKQTDENVKACKELLDDIGEEWVEKLIVALRMRSQTNYVVREIKAIQDFVGLANNRSMMMSFYDEHRKEWELKVREAQTGKKPWEL